MLWAPTDAIDPKGQTMNFFLDTANLDEIRSTCALGLLEGATTNPSLIAKGNANFEKR